MVSLREELRDSIPGRDVTNVSRKYHVQNAVASVHPRDLPHWSRWLQCQTLILSTIKVIQKICTAVTNFSAWCFSKLHQLPLHNGVITATIQSCVTVTS